MANSFVDTVVDGSTSIFSIPFSYIDRTHVSILVDGVQVAFEWINDASVSVVPAPVAGATVRIKRVTPKDPIVDFRDGENLTESDLDSVASQALFIAQESEDSLGSILQVGDTGHYDAESRRVENLADPVNAQDAVTKLWAETSMSSTLSQAIAARLAAQAAQSASETARDASDAARVDSETARDTAAAHASDAASSASSSAASASSAALSASDAAASASSASASLATAAINASVAATNATNAANSADAAAASASAAAASEIAASASASDAAASADTATNQAGIATAKASEASGYATDAATYVQQAQNITSPVGSVVDFPLGIVPPGWLVCDGSAVTSTYPLLRAALIDAGNPYGTSGEDPLLPDLRNAVGRNSRGVPDFMAAHTTPVSVGGGPGAADTWNDRPLNTVYRNVDNFVTMNGNNFILPAGNYYVEFYGNSRNTTTHRAGLFEAGTDNLLMFGSSEYAYNSQSRSTFAGVFNPTVDTELQFKHYTQTASANYSLGYQSYVLEQVHAMVKVWRLAGDTGHKVVTCIKT